MSTYPEMTAGEKVRYWERRRNDNLNSDAWSKAEDVECRRRLLQLREEQVAAYERVLRFIAAEAGGHQSRAYRATSVQSAAEGVLREHSASGGVSS